MSSASIPSQASSGPASGATALGASGPHADGGGHRHRRHLLGDAVRAISVFAGAAFDVAVLGDYAEARDEDDDERDDGRDDGGEGRGTRGRRPSGAAAGA